MDHQSLQQKGQALWQSLERQERCVCPTVSDDCFLAYGHVFSNLYELISAGTHPVLCRLLRMSGVEEAYISGNASDYDKLQALAEVLPLWAGHPCYAAIHDLLLRVFDCHLPLNPQNLPTIWQQTAARLSQADVSVGYVLKAYGYSHMTHPADDMSSNAVFDAGIQTCHVKDMTHFLSTDHHIRFPRLPEFPQNPSPPEAMKHLEECALADIQDAASQGCDYYTADLSSMETFPRPHPYPAGQAYISFCRDRELSPSEKDMVMAQMLRHISQNAARYGGGRVVLRGVKPALYGQIKAYLTEQKIKVPGYCVVTSPEDAAELTLEGAKVALEINLYASEGELWEILTRTASQMPLGRLWGLYLPVAGILELPLVDRIEQIFCGCLAAFGEAGMGPADTNTLQEISRTVLRP